MRRVEVMLQIVQSVRNRVDPLIRAVFVRFHALGELVNYRGVSTKPG